MCEHGYPSCFETKRHYHADLINYPSHYTKGGVDTYAFIKAKGLDYAEGNIVKYVVRSRHKGKQLEDLQKAKWYLEQIIKEAEKEAEVEKND